MSVCVCVFVFESDMDTELDNKGLRRYYMALCFAFGLMKYVDLLNQWHLLQRPQTLHEICWLHIREMEGGRERGRETWLQQLFILSSSEGQWGL